MLLRLPGAGAVELSPPAAADAEAAGAADEASGAADEASGAADEAAEAADAGAADAAVAEATGRLKMFVGVTLAGNAFADTRGWR
jgi:hypothetical protein